MALTVSTKLVQVQAASISLTYDLEDGHNHNNTWFSNGIVNASNLTCYAHSWADDMFHPGCPEPAVEQAIAHLYGDMALKSTCCNYTDLSEVQNSEQTCSYYCKREPPGQQQFAYRFLEYNPYDTAKIYPKLMSRIIITSSRTCFNYSIKPNPQLVLDGSDGDSAALEFQYYNQTLNGSIVIPKQSMGYDSTTYVYRG